VQAGSAGSLGIRLPDALIAPTAIEYKLILFNRSDFEGVRGLRLREIG
jgi:predicted nucleic acid-binding protein